MPSRRSCLIAEEAEEVVVEVGWAESVEERPLLIPLPVEVTVAAAVTFNWSSSPPSPPPQAAAAAEKSPSLNGLLLIGLFRLRLSEMLLRYSRSYANPTRRP